MDARINRRQLLKGGAIGAAVIAGAGGLGQLLASSDHVISRPTAREIDVTAFGADRRGVANSTDAINRAIGACHSTGGGQVRVPPGVYSITRRSGVSTNGEGGVYVMPGVSLIGYGATLRMDGNASHIQTAGLLTQPGPVATVMSALRSLDVRVGVDSSAGFRPHDEVFCRLGENPVDRPEASYWLFAKVRAIPDTTHIVLDRPVGVDFDPRSVTNGLNKTISKLVNPVSDVTIAGFRLTQGPSGVVQACIALDHVRRVTVRDITADNPGAGLVSYYSQQVRIDGYEVLQSLKQPGQFSKGRGLTFSGVRNCVARNVRLRGCVGGEVFCENYSQGVRVQNVDVDVSGKVARQGVFTGSQRSELSLESCEMRGSGSNVIFAVDHTLNCHITSRDLQLDVSPELLGGPVLANHSGYLRVRGAPKELEGNWSVLKKHSQRVALRPGVPATYVLLPDGLHRRVSIYASSLTGVSRGYLVTSRGHGANVIPHLAAGRTVELPPEVALTQFGSGLVPVAPTGRGLVLSTDPTVPKGAYLSISVEYYVASDPGTSG